MSDHVVSRWTLNRAEAARSRAARELPLPGVIVEGDADATPTPGWWARTRSHAGARMSYALLDQAVYSFGNLVVYALFRRHGSDRGFGAFVLTQRTLDVMFQLCNVFLWGPFCFHLPGTPEGRQGLYRGSVLLQQISFCAVCVGVLWGLGEWASGPAHARYAEVFSPLMWTAIGITFREYTRRMYFAEMRFREAFWTDVATVALQVAGVEWLVLHGAVTVRSTLGMLSAAAIVVSLWWVVREWRTFRVQLRSTLEDLRSDFSLGRWLFGSNMVNLLTQQCNPWILSSLLGVPAAGAYAVCEFPVNVPRVALTSLQNTMAPSMARRLAESGKGALHRMVLRYDNLLLAGAAAFVGVAWLSGPWFARMIFKSVPAEIQSVLLLLALNLLALAFTMARSYGLTAMGRADLTFYVNGLGLLVQGVAVVPLVRMFGLRGAAAALMLGTAATAILRAAVYAREVRRPRADGAVGAEVRTA